MLVLLRGMLCGATLQHAYARFGTKLMRELRFGFATKGLFFHMKRRSFRAITAWTFIGLAEIGLVCAAHLELIGTD